MTWKDNLSSVRAQGTKFFCFYQNCLNRPNDVSGGQCFTKGTDFHPCKDKYFITVNCFKFFSLRMSVSSPIVTSDSWPVALQSFKGYCEIIVNSALAL